MNISLRLNIHEKSERSFELNKKEQDLRDLEERLLKKQNQLNELIKNGHVIITPSLSIPPTTQTSPRSNNINSTTTTPTPSNLVTQPSTPIPSVSPFSSPSKDIARDPSTTTPQKKLDSKYYKTETTKVVQEKFYNVSFFHS